MNRLFLRSLLVSSSFLCGVSYADVAVCPKTATALECLNLLGSKLQGSIVGAEKAVSRVNELESKIVELEETLKTLKETKLAQIEKSIEDVRASSKAGVDALASRMSLVENKTRRMREDESGNFWISYSGDMDFVLQNNGNVVIYKVGGIPVWDSKTTK